MKYTRQLKCAILVIHFVLFGASLYAQTFNHPGILQSEADLNYVKAKISAKQEPWLSAYTGIRNSINLNYAPQGLVTLNDQADADAYMQDGLIAFKCALIWYYSGDAAYATKAKQILNAWTIYNDPDKDQNLNVHWGAINYMSAAEIINSMGGGWSAADVAAFKVFARRLTTHMYIGWYNNAQQTQIRSRMACAIFLEDRTLFNKCLEDWRYYIDVYYYVREDGLNPPKYPYPKIHGTTWELCRDFNHANMGSKGTFEGMAIAWNQGIDLYEEQKYRMTEFLETTTGFFMGTIPIPSDICGSSFANTPGVLYCNEQGRVWPTCTNNTQTLKENVYNHFKNRLGYNLPNTLAYNNARRTNSYFWVQVLTEYVAPFTTANCNATITSTTNSFCTGGSVLLTASAGASYKWFNGTTQVGTAASYTANAAGSYIVEVTNASVCKATSAVKNISVNALPTATITSPTNSFCTGGSIVLTSSAGTSYKWFNGTTQVGTAATYNANAAGSYTAEVTNAAGCKATSAAKIITLTTGTIWYADTDNDGKGDPSVTLTACTKPVSYVAVAGDACPTDANKITAGNCGCNNTEASCLDCAGIPNGSAAMDACMVCSGGTTGITPITNPVLCSPITGNINTTHAFQIVAQPNPFNDQIELIVPAGAHIQLTNMNGVIVYEKLNTTSISTNELSNGLYILRVTTEDGTSILKVVKQ